MKCPVLRYSKMMLLNVVLRLSQRIERTQPECVRIDNLNTIEPFAKFIVMLDEDFCLRIVQKERNDLI